MSSPGNRSKKACIQVQYHQYIKLSSISSKSGCPNNSIAAVVTEGLEGGGGVRNSLISKNLAHYSLSLKFLLIL